MRLALFISFAIPSIVFADVIDDSYEPPSCPPLTCPAGSQAYTGGHGSCPVGCVPTYLECTSDEHCNSSHIPGTTCIQTRFCVETRFAGRSGDVDVVIGEPDAEGACATGRPNIARRCTVPAPAPAPAPTPQSESDSSGCAASGSSRSFAFASLLCVALRRKRRPSLAKG